MAAHEPGQSEALVAAQDFWPNAGTLAPRDVAASILQKMVYHLNAESDVKNRRLGRSVRITKFYRQPPLGRKKPNQKNMA